MAQAELDRLSREELIIAVLAQTAELGDCAVLRLKLEKGQPPPHAKRKHDPARLQAGAPASSLVGHLV